MGICNSPYIFQEKMNKMFRGSEFIRAYINDLLIITRGDWFDHLNKLERVLKNHKDDRLKCNTKKSFFGKNLDEISGFLGDMEWNPPGKKN